VGIISKPGLLLQRLTTREPDDAMIEVAIKSVEAVFDWKDFLAGGDGAIKSADKSADEPDSKPADKSDKKTADKSDSKPANKPGSKSADKSDRKTADKSGSKPANKSGSKSADKSDSKQTVESGQDEVFLEEAAAAAEEPEKVSADGNRERKSSYKNPNEWPTGKIADEEDDEDDDILKALDQYFVLKQKKDN